MLIVNGQFNFLLLLHLLFHLDNFFSQFFISILIDNDLLLCFTLLVLHLVKVVFKLHYCLLKLLDLFIVLVLHLLKPVRVRLEIVCVDFIEFLS